MAFGGLRSSCVCPGAHSARHQDSHKDWTPYRMAEPFVSAGTHAPHSDETLGPTPTRGSSYSARRLRSLAFLGSSAEHVQPVQSAVHAPAGFIGMGHRRGDECVANRGDWRLQAGGGHPYGALEGAR